MEAKLRYQLGAKYSNTYFNPSNSNTGGVLPHMQPSNRQATGQQAASERTSTVINCQVLDCVAVKYRKCQAKECGRYTCRDHSKHNRHKNLQFKPTGIANPVTAVVRNPEVSSTDHLTDNSAVSSEANPAVSSEANPAVLSEANPAVTTDVGDIADDAGDSESITEDSGPKICQVMECEEEALHRCSKLNCLFFAVCELHYRLQHASHEHLFRKENSHKRART